MSSPRKDTDAPTAVGQIAFSLLHELGRARRRLVRGDDDTEALHDYRVALRRIRSVTRALGPLLVADEAPRLQRVLRRIARGTGPARDLEVLSSWVAQTIDTVPSRLARIFEHDLERRRRRATDDLSGVLRTRVHAEVVELFDAVFRDPEALLEGPPRPFGEVASEAARPLVAAAVAGAEALADNPGMAAMHELRIALKRVRYTIEAFAGAWPAGVMRLRTTLKRMQDQLGEVHDADLHAQWVVRAVVRDGRRRFGALEEGLDALGIGHLRDAIRTLGPEPALIDDTDRLLVSLEEVREPGARAAMQLLRRSGLPGLRKLSAALDAPRAPTVRRPVPAPLPLVEP